MILASALIAWHCQAGSISCEPLWEVKASFTTRRWPLVRVIVRLDGKDSVRTFFLDTGSNRSVIFDERQKEGDDAGASICLADGNPQPLRLAHVHRRGASSLFTEEVRRDRVDGFLGTEFFQTHDVLIDYALKKVYLSGPQDSASSEPQSNIELRGTSGSSNPIEALALAAGSEITLVPQSGKECIMLLPIGGRPQLPILDTGTNVICLKISADPTPGKKSETHELVEGFNMFDCYRREDLAFTIAGVPNDFRHDALMSDTADPLFPCSFLAEASPRVFLSFRRSSVFLFPPPSTLGH